MASRADPFPIWPSFGADERAAVDRVLVSGKVNYWTGEEARNFEREYAAEARTAHAIALANGTLALELALNVLNVGPGDEVVTSPRTFIASASCAVMRGATPVFADVCRDSQNITAESIERVLTSRTKAIIVVHLAGWPCEMDQILQLAVSRGIVVIEDCAQAHGARIDGKSVGSTGHCNSWSFCQDKIMTTAGEGGFVSLNDDEMWSRIWSYKDHGKSFEAVYKREHAPGFRWLHESIGSNWRLTEPQSAIGRVQLRKLPEWVETRRANAAVLTEILGDLDVIRIPQPREGLYHSMYKYYVYLNPDRMADGWTQLRVVEEISAQGIPAFVGSCSEIYREKAIADLGLAPEQALPVAKELGETSLMFLVHPTLDRAFMERAAGVIRDVLLRATRA
ncbi:MAG: DegT/DnrJ/EryC1/StrS aminotransferase family protein [Armatimonadetes bacterium]|nr:DegT/DnrJ/EryC1/StrS aminotransferase family protein [Armatimonadota bacterium]